MGSLGMFCYLKKSRFCMESQKNTTFAPNLTPQPPPSLIPHDTVFGMQYYCTIVLLLFIG